MCIRDRHTTGTLVSRNPVTCTGSRISPPRNADKYTCIKSVRLWATDCSIYGGTAVSGSLVRTGCVIRKWELDIIRVRTVQQCLSYERTNFTEQIQFIVFQITVSPSPKVTRCIEGLLIVGLNVVCLRSICWTPPIYRWYLVWYYTEDPMVWGARSSLLATLNINIQVN